MVPTLVTFNRLKRLNASAKTSKFMVSEIRNRHTGPEEQKSRGRESREDLVQRLVDPTLTLEETAMLLGVCPTTVRRYTNKNQLRHFRTGGNQRRFRLSDVLEFMDSRLLGDRGGRKSGPGSGAAIAPLPGPASPWWGRRQRTLPGDLQQFVVREDAGAEDQAPTSLRSRTGGARRCRTVEIRTA